jgi:hypothetical protein
VAFPKSFRDRKESTGTVVYKNASTLIVHRDPLISGNRFSVKTPGNVGCKKFNRSKFVHKYFHQAELKYSDKLLVEIPQKMPAVPTTTKKYAG